jgi:hypothetical protein
MPIIRKYECTGCHKEKDRGDLTVKKVGFFEMGVGGRALRSRVAGHLCPNCLIADEDFQRPAFEAAKQGQLVMRPDPVEPRLE